jgi:hypothetical protein
VNEPQLELLGKMNIFPCGDGELIKVPLIYTVLGTTVQQYNSTIPAKDRKINFM